MAFSFSVDIIIPCYNPEVGWDKLLTSQFTLIQEQNRGINFGFILVNDGSTVDINNGVENLQQSIGGHFRFFSYEENRGKGYAIRHGVKHSNSDYVIYTDIDLPYEYKDLTNIIDVLALGNDLVVGVRNKKYYNSLSLSRTIVSKLARILLQYILKLKISDTQCGLKGFSRKVKAIFLETRINRFLFDMEFILQAGRNQNFNIKTYPVSLREGVTFSRLNFRILIKEGMNFIKLYFLK